MTPHEITVPPTCICGKTDCEVPFGYCHCGCGWKTNISRTTHKRFGYIRGLPRKFAFGHRNYKIPAREEAVPFKIDGVYCRMISLSNGYYSIVDEQDYDWITQWNWSFATNLKKSGKYASRNIIGEDGLIHPIRMHRLIMGVTDPNILVDHRDGVGVNNFRSNLRIATFQQNCQNSRGEKTSTSRYKGVSWQASHRKWRVRIKVDGREKFIGRSDDEVTAAKMFDQAAKFHHKDYAFLNFPKE